LNDKPAAIVGAAGASGSARSQYHLRQVGVYLNLHFLNKPEVMANAFSPAFNEAGDVVDDTLQSLIRDQVNALVVWTRRLKG
jgi:chromate reductase